MRKMSGLTFVSGDFPVYHDRFEFALRSVVSRKGRRYSAAKRAGYDFNDVAGMLSSLDIMPVTPSGVVTGDSLGEEAVLAGVYFSELNDRAFSKQELCVLRNYIAWLEMSQRERVLQAFLRKISSAKKVRVSTVRAEGGYIMSFGSLADGSSAVSKDVLSCLLGVEVRVKNLSDVFYRRVLADTELDSVAVSDKAGLLKIGVRHEKSLFDYLMKSGAAYGGGGYRLRHELDKRYGGYEKYLYACMSNDALRVGMDNAVSEFIDGLNGECAQGENKWRVVGIDRYNLYYTDDTPLSGFKLCIGDGLFYSGLVGEARDDYDAVQAGRRETHESIDAGAEGLAEPEGVEASEEAEGPKGLAEPEGGETQDPEQGAGIADSADEPRNYVVDDIEETVASGTKGRPVGIYDDGTYPERMYSRYSRGDGHNRIVEYITPRRGVVLWPSSSYDEYGSKLKNSDKLDYTVMAEDAGLVVAGKGINRSGDRFSVGDTEARLGEYLNSNYVVVEGGAITNSTLRKLLADHCKMFYFGNHTNNVYGFTGVEKNDYNKSLLLTALQGLSGMCSLSTVPSSDVVAGVLNTEAGIPQMVSLRLDGDYLPGGFHMERFRSWCCSLLSGEVFEKMLALPKDSLEWVVFDALLGYLNFGRFRMLRGDEDNGAGDRASSEFVVPVDTSVDAFNKAVIHVYCILMGCQYSRICQE